MKIAFNILFYGIVIYIALIGGLFFAQRDMIYAPSAFKPDIKATGIIGLEEITVQTQDGLPLFGWYKPPTEPVKATILMFHGNAGNVAQSAVSMQPFMAAGYGVLLAEYRGYSANPGKPNENGIYDDARAFWSWLVKKTPAENIILYGQSLGAAGAIQLAYENPVLRGLVVVTPFTSMLELARARYPFIPVSLLLKDRYDNLEKIRYVRSPIIVVHGDVDELIPLSHGNAVFEAAPEPKSLVVVQGANHNDIESFGSSEKILSLLAE